ncbi:MAG: excinuclease ABC subunit UvrA [Patescibacteria group bacterium]|nr:excinuclease ABC subunit UvrA [Patescibacteria group bacterium]
MNNLIKIRGARVNNLKNIDLEIPRDKFVVVTGLSGSGKSSLVFDLIYAESQRRYVESLSSYARQFIGLMDKPDVDLIEGLIPAISIDQRSAGNNPRSTVGTVSEIYDYFRLLFAKLGDVYCPDCGAKMSRKKIAFKNNSKKDLRFFCPKCSRERADLKAIDFSFNSSQGACPSCGGLGVKMEVDPIAVLNMNLNISQGAIKPWLHYNFDNQNNLIKELEKLAYRHKFDFSSPLKKLSKKEINLILHGDQFYPGVLQGLRDKYQETDSNYIRQKINQYMKTVECPDCRGQRLKKEILDIKFQGLSIYDLSNKNIEELRNFFKKDGKNFKLLNEQRTIFDSISKEIILRAESILNVGLAYLSISRPATTLSGGESQRLRLAHQISSNLVGLLYVLDEPSIGLHPKDNENLIATLRNLNDKGNGIVVIEHDTKMMLSSDYIIDVGPRAGEHGGEIIFSGSLEKFRKDNKSLTAQYLFGDKSIVAPHHYRKNNGKFIKIMGASENNLKNINVDIPLENLVVISGVSGSGKSTLMIDILAKALNKKFYRAKEEPGQHQSISGSEWIDKIIDIDQSPIGKTPRSNPATYTGVFSYIRDLLASLPEASRKGLKPRHFSFNLKGGRCEKCQGDGLLKVEMQFLPDVYVKCDECGGQRYQSEVLAIKYNNKNIFEILEMTIEEALKFFNDEKNIKAKLEVLNSIGLGYIKLGQSATTLSGGESQRIKLAYELSRPSTGKTLYILDEPTTGLHFEDVKNLLKVLHGLVDKGNTVLVIEHNLDIIKSADWIIDLGPEGGNKGGEIVASGTPRDIIKSKKSYTGRYLKELI